MKKRTVALLVGLFFGVGLIVTGFVLAATTILSCPSILYNQDLYYGGAVVASFSLAGLAYTFRKRVRMVAVVIAMAIAVVSLAVFVAGFIFGLCGSFT